MPAKKRASAVKFSQAIAGEICQLIAEGMSLRNVCLRPGAPTKTTVMRWLASGDHPEFVVAYQGAFVAQADAIEEDMADIESKLIRGRRDHQRAKVALSSMQWRAERRAPKKYGTKIQQEITGRDGGPVVISGAPSDADL
jgi:hypothetical protein